LWHESEEGNEFGRGGWEEGTKGVYAVTRTAGPVRSGKEEVSCTSNRIGIVEVKTLSHREQKG